MTLLDAAYAEGSRCRFVQFRICIQAFRVCRCYVAPRHYLVCAVIRRCSAWASRPFDSPPTFPALRNKTVLSWPNHTLLVVTSLIVRMLVNLSRRDRFLHGRLLIMHVLASLAQTAALAKYTIPATDASCLVTHRLMMALLLFYDVSKPKQPSCKIDAASFLRRYRQHIFFLL